VAILDARTGRLLRIVPLRADKYGAPSTVEAVAERRDRALAANAAGAHLFDPRTGAVIRDYLAMDGVAALDQRTGRLVVTTIGPRYFTNNPMGIGTVSVLDDWGGDILAPGAGGGGRAGRPRVRRQ